MLESALRFLVMPGTVHRVIERPNNGMKPTAGMGALDQLEKQPVSPAAAYAER